ncbi:uncharacterized protein M437DRAFT_65544 [Aureobasidium melanogenum CBS 110374]|uniref:Uncharacterized protein n=1 Tax=Aureobasidium melanogenum (strain CBS 110374) TaxID=1043003 RepID=A0A074VS78_AURM1|nr:uncharacterized protein M437DRAFT_65544 [Aureobasidium melanogenum CBS 110374]KEQ63595.1 hypothetical protein M437DRAFT_65544 [Aureobasidium melanogenum CBS 110374]
MAQTIFYGTRLGRLVNSTTMTRSWICILAEWTIHWRAKWNAVFDVNDTESSLEQCYYLQPHPARKLCLHQWTSISRNPNTHGFLGKVVVEVPRFFELQDKAVRQHIEPMSILQAVPG